MEAVLAVWNWIFPYAICKLCNRKFRVPRRIVPRWMSRTAFGIGGGVVGHTVGRPLGLAGRFLLFPVALGCEWLLALFGALLGLHLEHKLYRVDCPFCGTKNDL